MLQPVVEAGGARIPLVGLGTWELRGRTCARLVEQALRLGYRHIDTAEMYGNEKEVGEAVRASGLDRGEVYITSKLNNGYHQPEDARRAFDGTLEALGSDYVDLFLIHWPLPTLYRGDFVSTWHTLEEFYSDGRARSIGLSNFQVAHVRRVVDESEVVPAVNQIEAHPYLCNEEVRAANAEFGIVTEAWSPLAKGRVLQDPTVGAIASRIRRTPAQVVLRWHIQRGDVIFPKSTTPARMKENFEIFDFELGAEDLAAISTLDRGEPGRTGPDPDVFARVSR